MAVDYHNFVMYFI